MRVMTKMLGQRQITRQESCHLINHHSIVCCSHFFGKIDLQNNSRRLKRPSVNQKKNETATLLTLIDAYSDQTNPKLWPENKMPNTEYLEKLSLVDFSQQFRVGGRGSIMNLLVPQKETFVPIFFPAPSSDPAGKQGFQYCKYALMRFKPWKSGGDIAWKTKEYQECEDDVMEEYQTKEEVINNWKKFVEEMKTTGQPIPDSLQREINNLKPQPTKNASMQAPNGMNGANEPTASHLMTTVKFLPCLKMKTCDPNSQRSKKPTME